MKPGWMAVIVFVWLVGAILGATYDDMTTDATWPTSGGTGGYTETTPANKLQYLTDLSNAVQQSQLLGGITIPLPNVDYFTTAYQVATWKFTFFEDYYMLYWLLIMPFVIISVFFFISLVYGVLTGNFFANG